MVTMRTAAIPAMAPSGFRAGLQTDEDDSHSRQAEGQTKQISLHRNSSSNNGTLTNNHVLFGQSTDATLCHALSGKLASLAERRIAET
jgi:hypothetical protein